MMYTGQMEGGAMHGKGSLTYTNGEKVCACLPAGLPEETRERRVESTVQSSAPERSEPAAELGRLRGRFRSQNPRALLYFREGHMGRRTLLVLPARFHARVERGLGSTSGSAVPLVVTLLRGMHKACSAACCVRLR